VIPASLLECLCVLSQILRFTNFCRDLKTVVLSRSTSLDRTSNGVAFFLAISANSRSNSNGDRSYSDIIRSFNVAFILVMDTTDVLGNSLITSHYTNKYCSVMGGIAVSCQYHKAIYKACLHIM
jgi:hypothetical protein